MILVEKVSRELGGPGTELELASSLMLKAELWRDGS